MTIKPEFKIARARLAHSSTSLVALDLTPLVDSAANNAEQQTSPVQDVVKRHNKQHLS